MDLQASYFPAPPRHPDFLESQRLEEVEKQLGQRCGKSSPQGIQDSMAVLQEVERRAQSLWGRFRRIVLIFLHKINLPASNDDDVEELRKLHCPRPSLRPNPQLTLSQVAPHPIEDRSRFWAVLVGIDAYESNPLHGCVSDALLVKSFLTKDLCVPEERIQCLLGSRNSIAGDSSTPSRANIVNTLRSLIDNPKIQRGDNIIIYYAGHGSSYYCSEHFSTAESKCQTGTCPVEALCPIDRDTMDANGHWIPDISDREVNTLFTQISRTKGHKITFIADCCHASSFDRQDCGSEAIRTTRPTFHSDVNDMLRAADQRLNYIPLYRSVLSENWRPDMSSHVILAACLDYQTARETSVGKKWGGVFSRALVGVLTSGAWKKETTYVELTQLLNQSYSQTPVVAGEHKFERIWYSK